MAVIWPQNLQIKPNSSAFWLYLLHPSLQWTHIHTETPSERQQFGIWSFCLGTTEFRYVIRCNGCLNMRTNSSGWTHIAALTSNRMLFELKMEHQQKLVVTYSANRPPIFPSIFSMEIFTLNANIFLSWTHTNHQEMANFSIDNHKTALVSDAIESARAQSLNRKINIKNHKKHKRTENDYLQNGFFFISKGKIYDLMFA